ncbi:MAG: hypothetical protein KAI02_05940 [Gammaproteobacteria bacterium]|nr:hypothetical protein [Gammaproteobacteria bacterium]
MPSLTKNNFLNLIQLHVPLEQHGTMFSGYCPFCFDNEETFIAYSEEQKWTCFSCQKKGNITYFIEETESLSKQDAEIFIDQFIQQAQNTEDINSEPEPEIELIPESEPEPEIELIPEPEPEPEIELIPEPEPEPEIELIPEPEPEPKIELIPEPEPEPEIELSASDHSDIKMSMSPHSELDVSHIEVDNTEIAISHSEIITSDPEMIISNVDNIGIIEQLLATFHDCSGCHGISIIHTSDNTFIGSSMNEFNTKDILALNLFVLNTLKLAHNILGDFDNNSSKLIFRMNVVIQSTPKKLIWVPMHSKEDHKYNMLILLDGNVSEKMLLIKLKKHLENIDI